MSPDFRFYSYTQAKLEIIFYYQISWSWSSGNDRNIFASWTYPTPWNKRKNILLEITAQNRDKQEIYICSSARWILKYQTDSYSVQSENHCTHFARCLSTGEIIDTFSVISYISLIEKIQSKISTEKWSYYTNIIKERNTYLQVLKVNDIHSAEKFTSIYNI